MKTKNVLPVSFASDDEERNTPGSVHRPERILHHIRSWFKMLRYWLAVNLFALPRHTDDRTAQEQVYDLLQHSPIPVSVVQGPEHHLVFVSQRTQNIVGNRSLLGLPMREAFPEYSAQGILEHLDHVYATGEPLTLRELRVETFHHSDGPPTPIEQYFNVVYHPLRTPKGTINGVVIFNIDITDQVHTHRQIEQLMREREQERDQLREALAREQHMRAVAEQEIIQRQRLERQTQETLQSLLVLAESMISLPVESKDKGETEKVLSPPLVQATVAQRLVELIRSVLNCQRVSITILDPHTHELRSAAVVGLSPEQEQYWKERRSGYSLSDQISGTALRDQFKAGNVVVMDMRKPPFSEQPNPYGIRIGLLAPMYIDTRLIGILALDHGGEDWIVSESEKNLTRAVARLAALVLERERLLEERAESQASILALQHANQLKDEFIGIAGHELRTPLTTIKISIQLARRQLQRQFPLEVQPSTETEHLFSTLDGLLDRAERQVGMQNRLINDLLDLSRIQAGRLELHLALTDLATLVKEIVQDQQILMPQRNIFLEQYTCKEILVLADADRLRQVVTNYLTNALKYSSTEQPVFVRSCLLEGQVRIEVEDRGPGLSQEQQQRIWERFYRVPGIEVKSGSGVGLGLGLYISRMIIERHGGHVGVESTQGQGSTFWLTLPLAE
jgi:signal transduction histidine kinase